MDEVPGSCGSIGPFGSAEYCQPHVYARDITSGAGNCVCGAALCDDLHTESAPGVPIPEGMRSVYKAANPPQRYVLGIAYMPGMRPEIAKGLDGGRDYFTEAELEKAAFSFLADGPPEIGIGHIDGTTGCATVVESYVWRGPDWDFGNGVTVTKGTWLIGAILDEHSWSLAQAGKLNGFSMQGAARRRAVNR